MSYVAFLFLTATPDWLVLTEQERDRVVAEELQPALAHHRDAVRIRYYDTEAYSARASDVVMLEFDTPGAHAKLIDELRSSPIFSKPYFILEELLVGEQAGWLEAR